MNRKDRRRQEKLRKKMLVSGAIGKAIDVIDDSYEWKAVSHPYKSPDPEPKEVEIPGVNVPPVDPEFVAKVNSNSWHDISELDQFIATIKALSEEDNRNWSWSRNWNSKYR